MTETENTANCEWHLLAKDGIYVDEAPRPLGTGSGSGTLYMGPGNRVDVAMRCANLGSMTLGSTKVDDTDIAQTEILRFEVTDIAAGIVADGELPRFHPYRPDYLADVYDTTLPVVTQAVNFQGGGGSCTINGVAWQGGAEGTENGELETGSVQEWTVTGNNRHPFHLHVNSYQLKTLTNNPGDGFYEQGDWHDVVLTPGNFNVGQYVFPVDTFFTKSVLHCHFLTHEDLGCMGFFQHVKEVSGEVTTLTGHAMSCSGESTDGTTYTSLCQADGTPTTSPTKSPTTYPTITPSAATVVVGSPSLAPSGAPSKTPTVGDDPAFFVSQVVDFGNLTTIAARRNTDEWMGETAGVCENAVVKRFNVLSIKSVIQSPSADMMNIIVHVQHRKQSIIRDRAFLKLSIMRADDVEVFREEQNLFEETAMLTHFTAPVDLTDDTVKEDLKIGLQVNFTDAGISPFDMSFAAIIEVGINDVVGSSTPKVYDCVKFDKVGVTG
jgi:hypothetical protein